MSRRRHSAIAIVHRTGHAVLELLRRCIICPLCHGTDGQHRENCEAAHAAKAYQEFLSLERQP